MERATIGIIIIVICLLGNFSNWLNWRFLNYKINHLLYYFGAFVHETSHAILCLLTGAKVTEYKVFSKQPHVIYTQPKIPILGNFLISIAPILGGMALLFFVNKYLLVNHFIMPAFSSWKFFLNDFWNLFRQIDITEWKNLLIIFLFLNIGAMISPSRQDLKNVWFLVIVFMFIQWPLFTKLGFLAISLILVNIIFQIVLAIVINLIKKIIR